MAASAPGMDFLHLVSSHIQALTKRPVETLVDTGGNGKIGPMLEYAKAHDFRPNAILIQGGENDPFDANFRINYDGLLDLYHGHVVVLGDWWNDQKSEWEAAEARARGFSFVDLRAIQKIPDNSGDGGPYHIPGVASHPSDKGHAAIASAINAVYGFDESSK
jgi:hypothetical protein